MSYHQALLPHKYTPPKPDINDHLVTHGDTESSAQKFNDVEELQLDWYSGLAGMTIYHDKSGVTGFDVEYQKVGEVVKGSRVNMEAVAAGMTTAWTLLRGEYITKVKGAYNGFINKLEIVTNWRSVVNIGGGRGQEFEVNIPYGYTVKGFSGSYTQQRLISLAIELKPERTKFADVIILNKTGDNVEGDNFDDFNALIRGEACSRIASVTVKQQDGKLLGLEATYKCSGGQVKSTKPPAGESSGDNILAVNRDQYIAKVSGTEENGVIKSLSFTLNNERTRQFGSPQGSEFSYEVPYPKRLVAFGGKTSGEGLHQLKLFIAYPYPFPA